jgi:predicted O-methyltransferase YrrM
MREESLDSKEVSKAVWHDKGKGLREKECLWLIDFCLTAKPNIVLDIGTGWGVTGRIFSLTAQKVYSVDVGACGYARKAIAEYGNTDRVVFIQSPSIDALLPIKPHTADLCFIDAGHPTLYVIADFLKYSRFVKDGGVICFHDCDRKDVVEALDIILKQNPKLQEGYQLTQFHAVDITRAFAWERLPEFKPVDINRVDPRKAGQ